MAQSIVASILIRLGPLVLVSVALGDNLPWAKAGTGAVLALAQPQLAARGMPQDGRLGSVRRAVSSIANPLHKVSLREVEKWHEDELERWIDDQVPLVARATPAQFFAALNKRRGRQPKLTPRRQAQLQNQLDCAYRMGVFEVVTHLKNAGAYKQVTRLAKLAAAQKDADTAHVHRVLLPVLEGARTSDLQPWLLNFFHRQEERQREANLDPAACDTYGPEKQAVLSHLYSAGDRRQAIVQCLDIIYDCGGREYLGKVFDQAFVTSAGRPSRGREAWPAPQ